MTPSREAALVLEAVARARLHLQEAEAFIAREWTRDAAVRVRRALRELEGASV